MVSLLVSTFNENVQEKYEYYTEFLIEAGGIKGVERIKPSDPQVKGVIERDKGCV